MGKSGEPVERAVKPQPIPLPSLVVDETGHRYDRLMVLSYAGRAPSGHALWLCRCDCGKQVTVRGNKLRGGTQVSCGCWRANPDVRQAARMKTPARRRKAIASMGGEAAVGVPRKREKA